MEHPTPRILVVDDDPEIIDLIHEILDLMESEVLVCNTGEEGLAFLYKELQQGRYIDVVLLDVMMPGEDGFHILDQMKTDPQLSQIPVIMITGLNSVMAKTRGLQIGAEDYITKPFDPQELLARVGVVMRIRRTENMLRQRNQELAALDDINRTISSSLDLDEVLTSALSGLSRLVKADALAVILNDEESDAWVIRAARTTKDVWLEGRVIPDDDEILVNVSEEVRTIFKSTVTQTFWNTALDVECLEILCVPLAKNEEVVGAMVAMGSIGTLTSQHTPLVEHIAATVAVAVEKARLFRDLEVFAGAIERSQNQLIQAEKMAAVGRLAASLAHEINNPLQAIQNGLHLALHKDLAEDDRRRFLEMAQTEVNRLVQIVRRMLDFYRPSTTTQQFVINRPVEDALAIAGKRLQQNKIRVEARLSPSLPPVSGTANQLTQVFLNIIINSIEAMPDGGTLWVGTAHDTNPGQEIVVAFRDSGSGIPADVRSHLFEPFHTSKPTGTGLGLAISYGIIERHRGLIEVDSPPGGGTTFIIRLPEYRE
ncbi:MAG: response regulator [Anaerolineae bacterium]|nr:response regulator [Anaerolineae bacterium]